MYPELTATLPHTEVPTSTVTVEPPPTLPHTEVPTVPTLVTETAPIAGRSLRG